MALVYNEILQRNGLRARAVGSVAFMSTENVYRRKSARRVTFSTVAELPSSIGKRINGDRVAWY